MSRARHLRIRGHTAVRAPRGTGGPVPHCPDGSLILGRAGGPGHAKCECGEVSAECFGGEGGREQWHRRHREELAEVPWSDAAIAREYA